MNMIRIISFYRRGCFNKKDRKTSQYMDTPAIDTPSIALEQNIDKSMIRTKRTTIPHLAEPDVVRHYVNLSSNSF